MEMMTSLCTGGLRGNEVCLQEDGEDALLVCQVWVRHSKDSKVPHEPLAEFGDVSGGVWIDRGAVCDTVDIAPSMCVLIVEATIINVFSHQFYSRLLS